MTSSPAINPAAMTDKTILVTGASSGIGKEIALLCASLGAKVCAVGRNSFRLNQTVEALDGTGHQAHICDLTSQSDLQTLVDNLPQLHGVVHCAGIGSRVICKNIEQSDIDAVFTVNTFAPMLLQSALLREKKITKSASIVFIASMAPDKPTAGNAIYSASKAAIIAYAKVLAVELAQRLIRVNCVSPAMIWTDLITADGIDEYTLKEDQNNYLLKRYGQPADVANLVAYLLSDVSSWMTGENIHITGGLK